MEEKVKSLVAKINELEKRLTDTENKVEDLGRNLDKKIDDRVKNIERHEKFKSSVIGHGKR
jgi:peptidoglycan hydrolase CwlO-like protein